MLYPCWRTSSSVRSGWKNCLRSLLKLATLDVEELEEKASNTAEMLSLIRDTLPEDARGEALPALAQEAQRLSLIVANLLSPGSSDSHEQALLRLVTNWRKIFGKQEDFARPILERASILAATCLISGGYYLREQQFDWAIIDEAGRATAPELLVPRCARDEPLSSAMSANSPRC